MKNIHLLPTSSPSKIFYIAENFHLEKGQRIEPKSYQHIYITSDEEIKEGELKKGDWYYSPIHNKIFQCIHNNEVFELERKIILTTDQDLIKDGVQAIDDNFLEWFIKNPSCEYVEVRYEKIRVDKNFNNISHWNRFKYKIIIPQEELKPIWKLNSGKGATLCHECYVIISEGLTEELFCEKCKPKQETIEEVAANLADPNICKTDNWIAGAKWQAEKMYSEEEVKSFLDRYRSQFRMDKNIDVKQSDFIQWFEQFKKG
jgi:hypothetical protein